MDMTEYRASGSISLPRLSGPSTGLKYDLTPLILLSHTHSYALPAVFGEQNLDNQLSGKYCAQ
jgi:hypothetical protein